MARTVVPPERGRVIRGKTRESAAQGDSFPERLVKYVPAETLAFFVPASAAIGQSRKGLLITVIVVATIGTMGYLWLNSRGLEDKKKPLPHFYVLAALAFLTWATGTAMNVAKLLGFDAVAGGIVLLIGVFLIPLVDGVLNQLLVRASPRRS